MTKRLGLVPGTDDFLSLFPETRTLDRLSEGFWPSDLFVDEREWAPAFDVAENENEYVIKGEIPGIDSKDLDISLLDGVVISVSLSSASVSELCT